MAQSEAVWFTVMGDLGDPTRDLVQLNMVAMAPRGAIRHMQLRVALAESRRLDSGEVMQSYISKIALDCEEDSIVHVEQTRFTERRWTGAQTVQTFAEVRPMAFAGLNPSPKATILKAACLLKR